METVRPRKTRRYRRRTVRVDVEYDGPDGPRRGTATTLGAGGIFVATEDPLDEQSPLRVRFCLPDGAAEFELEGRVVWANRPSDRHPHTRGMGVEFTNPGACTELALALEDLDGDAPAETPRSASWRR